MCAGILSVGYDVGEVTQPWRLKLKDPAVPLGRSQDKGGHRAFQPGTEFRRSRDP